MSSLWRIFHVSIFLSLTLPVFSDVEFPKDQRTDHHEFPPKVSRKRDKLVPVGHLRPFGFQRRPEGPVVEYKEALHPERFWKDHVSKKLPCVYRGDVADSPAMTKWDDGYLMKNYGDLDVLVEVKKEDRTTRPKRMTIKTFLKGYLKEDWYIVSVLPDEMRGEVKASKSFLCGTFTKTIQETNFWMSSGETASVIHYDADHNLHCLLAGRKDFVMIDPIYYEELYMVEKGPLVGSGFSQVDVDMINMFKHGNVAKAKWTWATLWPGDCIYIPAGYIHQVRSYGRSISATTLFTSYDEFDAESCKGHEFPYTSMRDINVMWTYKKGDKVIEIGYMNTDILRENLLILLGEKRSLRIERFAQYFNHLKYDIDPEDDAKEEDVTDEVREIFYKLDLDEKDFLTKSEIEGLTLEQLKEFARMVDLPTYPPDKPNFEYEEDKSEEKDEQREDGEGGEEEVKEEEDEEVAEKEVKTEEGEEVKEERVIEEGEEKPEDEPEEEPKGHGHEHHDHDEL